MTLSGTMPHTGVSTASPKEAPSSLLVHSQIFESYCDAPSPGGTGVLVGVDDEAAVGRAATRASSST